MKNFTPSSNNLIINNSNIQITGLCSNPSAVDISNGMFSEKVINDFIILPSTKPPIREITAIDAKYTLLNYKVIHFPVALSSGYAENYGKKRITGRKISTSGVICLDITYTAEDDTSSNQTFQGKLPYTCYITISDNNSLSDKFDIYCCIQNINIISIENSTINVSVNFTVFAEKNPNPMPIISNKCSCSTSSPLTTIGVSPEYLLHKLIRKNDKIWNEISFSKNIILPSNLPNAKIVTSISSKIEVISQEIIDSPPINPSVTNYYGENLLGKKLVIEAMLKQRISYIAENLTNTSHSLIINLPVSCYIMLLNETDLNQKFKIDVYIEDLYSCCIDEGILFSGAILFFKAKEITNCAPIYINKSCCNCLNNFNIEYRANNLCDMKSISSIIAQGSWSESTIYRRVYTSLNFPIEFIKSASTSIKIVSINTATTPNSNSNISHEGFSLKGFIAIVDGYAITDIIYSIKNPNGSVVGKTFNIPFSEFIVLGENPNTISKKNLVVTPCLENFFVNILDENGIGVYAQLFLKAELV